MPQQQPPGSGVEFEAAIARHRDRMHDGLRRALGDAWSSIPADPDLGTLLSQLRGQIEYHLGWRQTDLSAANQNTGKLLRPALTALACELAAGSGTDSAGRTRLLRQAVLAGACVELVHNFSLVHDDIEDGDEERRHRPTVWKLWGVPLAINTGDTIVSVAQLRLWSLLDEGADPAVVVRLAGLLDRTVLTLCEGQFLDISCERRLDVTPAMYMDMIERKTAALMSCCMRMGATLAAPDDEALVDAMARFGRHLGLAFQLRDDLLGIWAAEGTLGKLPAGDLRRKKMTLPMIYALEGAAEPDRRELAAIYRQEGPSSDQQIDVMLAILDRVGARGELAQAIASQTATAREALDDAAGRATGGARHLTATARRAYRHLGDMLDYIGAAAWQDVARAAG